MAQGNLLIMPRRVVFEGAKKSQDLVLTNTGNDSAKYVVSFVQMRMKHDGSFEQIATPDSGQNFSEKYFRIFPRTVTLGPNKSQVVKMQLVKPAKMMPGEYMSHIYFRAIPKENPLGEEAQKEATSVSVRLIPIFGITIPAIIRVGECSVKAEIKDLALRKVNDTVTVLKMKFTRSGNISVYGDLSVTYTSPLGKVTHVAGAKGIAVYTPGTYRTFECPLDRSSGIDYRSGKLTVTYTVPDDVKAARLAEAELILP